MKNKEIKQYWKEQRESKKADKKGGKHVKKT